MPPIEISDIKLAPDITGSAIIVWWRGVPVGFVRPLKRAPQLGKWSTAEQRAQTRAHYKPHIGKWYSTLTDTGYHDTSELAASALVEKLVQSEFHRASSPLLRAAILGDSSEVEKLMQKIRAQASAAFNDQTPVVKTQRQRDSVKPPSPPSSSPDV